MRKLLWVGGVAALTVLVPAGTLSTSAPTTLSAAQATDDKATVKMLANNLLAQQGALDEKINAVAGYKWGAQVFNNPTVPVGGKNPPKNNAFAIAEYMSDWSDITPAWPVAPSMDDATNAANVLKGSISKVSAWPDAPTGEEVLKFAVNRCKGAGLGSMLEEKNRTLNLGITTPDLGKKFDAMRDRVCKAITTAAHVKARYDQYQAAKTNGIYLIQRFKRKENRFGGFTRTTQSYFFAKWYPDVANTVVNGPDVETQLVYEARFKMSDNNWMTLADLKEWFSELKKGLPKCKGIRIYESGSMKVKVSVGETTTSSATIEACMEYHAIGDTVDVDLGSMKVPAPFGYMAELESMKDNAKQDLKNKLIDQIFGVFTDEQMGKINKLYDLIEKLQ